MIKGKDTRTICKKERKTDRTRSKKEETGVAQWSLPDQSASSKRHIRHRNERLTVLLATSNKRRHSCPGHRCFEKVFSYQLGLRRPTLPKLRHLLTQLRQRQQTSLAIIKCFLDFSSHTPAYTPGFHHPAAATPMEWQPAPATRVTLFKNHPFESCKCFLLCPILLKLHILAQLIDTFQTPYSSWSCIKEKMSFSLYMHQLSSEWY